MGLRAQVLTTAVARRIYRLLTTEMPMTPSPLAPPGGGGPTQDLPGPRGESPAIGGVGLDSFGPNPTANPVGAEEGGSSDARTTSLLGTDGVRHGARFPRRARGEGPALYQPPHRRRRRPSRGAPRVLRAQKLLPRRDRGNSQKAQSSPPLQGAPRARVRLRGTRSKTALLGAS